MGFTKTKTSSNLDFSKINPVTSGFMLASVIFGSALILMPSIVSNLGVVSYTMLLFWCFTLFYYSEILAVYVLGEILGKKNDRYYDADAAERRPLQFCCQILFGKQSHLTSLFSIVQLLAIGMTATSFFLILASTLQATFPPLPIDSSAHNITRIWIFVVFLMILPLHFIDNYKSMSYVGTLATLVIFLGLVVALIASIIISVSDIPTPSVEQKKFLLSQLPLRSVNLEVVFFSSFGSMAFVTAGCMNALPNIAFFMPETKLLSVSVSVSKATLFVLYLVAGIVPYALLKDFVIDTSIMVTLQRIASSSNMTSLNFLCRLNEILTFVHFVCASVILLNPLHLLLETVFNIPNSKYLD